MCVGANRFFFPSLKPSCGLFRSFKFGYIAHNRSKSRRERFFLFVARLIDRSTPTVTVTGVGIFLGGILLERLAKEKISFYRVLGCHISLPANKRITVNEALDVD